jgi:glycolate oxidase subunit GlcD
MLNPTSVKELQRIVGRPNVSASPVDTELYSYDASLAKGAPSAVVFPADGREVSRVVRWAAGQGIPFVPRGFGTNLSGGTVLPDGGLIVSLSRMNRILGLFPARRCAVVQPGVTNLELQNALAPSGFFFAPDPASQKVSTLGGNVAENSGGPHCLKYGVTTNHILGLEAVLSDGERIRVGGALVDPPGLDLRGALIGSEGTFGIVTEITARILPKPEKIMTQLAVYDDIAAAARSVSEIIAAGIVPATLEMMDAPIIRAVEDSYACGYPRDAAAVLIIEIEGLAAGMQVQADRIRGICMDNGCREIRDAADELERGRLWEGRRGAFGAVARLAPNYLVNDCTVPRTKLPEALARIEAIVRKHRFDHGNVFHAGDGNLHPLILFDSRDAGQLERVHRVGREIMQACVALGGTITGEHGVGLEKMTAMRLVFSEEDLEVQRFLQRAFDPLGLLNPGKVIPPPEEPQPGDRAAGDRPLPPDGAERKIADRIRSAVNDGRALQPRGCGTLVDYGNAPGLDTEALSSTDLAEIIELDTANQVVTAGAGMRLGDLQRLLAERRQWLPLRPPFAIRNRSLGGVVALGLGGPERVGYGAPRDLVLGLQFVDARGRLINTGGRVVKNVAGYDLTRLMVGSAGTLGFITRVTFRIASLPERCALLSATGTLAQCRAAAAALLTSNLLPVFLSGRPAVGVGPGETAALWEFAVGFEGFGDTVENQLRCSESRLAQCGLEDRKGSEYDPLDGPFGAVYEAIVACAHVIRAELPADRTADRVPALTEEAMGGTIHLDFGGGRILAGFQKLEDQSWQRICRLTAGLEGNAVLMKAPPAFKRRHDVFGPPDTSRFLLHRIKAALDPRGVFNPGRLPGRL